MSTPLHISTARTIFRSQPAYKKQVFTDADFQITKHNDLLAALVVAEGSEDEFLKTATDHFILAAKMLDSEGFEAAKTKFAGQPSVLFVNPDRVMDGLMTFIDRLVKRRDWKGLKRLREG